MHRSVHRITFRIVRNYVINITKRNGAIAFWNKRTYFSIPPARTSTSSDKLTGIQFFTVKKSLLTYLTI